MKKELGHLRRELDSLKEEQKRHNQYLPKDCPHPDEPEEIHQGNPFLRFISIVGKFILYLITTIVVAVILSRR